MSIKIYLGNVGSGKTVSCVREMANDMSDRVYFSNIKTTLENQKTLTHENIIIKEIKDYKSNKKTGQKEPIYEYKVNIDYWKNLKVPCHVILDEAHSIVNSRRSMSKINILVTEWLALIRRVLGEDSTTEGDLIFITQLPMRIDSIARDMATVIKYHKCHYLKTCTNCEMTFQEHNLMPKKLKQCPKCNGTFRKHSHMIEVWEFSNMERYNAWSLYGNKTYYDHYRINDIGDYFPMYDTLQWDNLFSSL